MKTEIKLIKKGQYLVDIMDFIPANAIIRKTLPGIGATTLEITAKRHSIIIEPNVPVIEGKQKKHLEILGVKEGVTRQAIVAYLEGDVEFKKIITTPESYHKVQGAFRQLRINYLEDYFFLFDECERIAQDIDYRETIDAPMDDFWKFKNRSFISATPIQPTSKEFKMQGFTNIVIQPDYDFKQDITIWKTPNVLAMVKESLKRILSDRTHIVDTHCYFINSMDMIHCIIKDLKIKDISNIYCSAGAVKKFKALEYENTFSSLTPTLNTFNFFTSRFYSAVDIELPTKPHVTIVTDTEFAPHTMVIPQTESVQIVGRFRNGVKSIEHITNVNSLIPYKSIETVKKEIQEGYIIYKMLQDFLNGVITEVSKTVINDVLDRLPFAQLLTPDQTNINWFKYENKLLDQMTMNTYHDLPYLINAYQDSKNFNVKDLDFNTFNFDDKKYFRQTRSNKKEERKEIVAQLDAMDLTVIDENVYEIESLAREDELIVSAYLKLGKDFIEKVDYNEHDIRIALHKKAFEDKKTTLPEMDAILDIFVVGRSYTENEIKTMLNKINLQFSIGQKATATDFLEGGYFHLSERKNIYGKKGEDGKIPKGYTIISARMSKKKLGQGAGVYIANKKSDGFVIK